MRRYISQFVHSLAYEQNKGASYVVLFTCRPQGSLSAAWPVHRLNYACADVYVLSASVVVCCSKISLQLWLLHSPPVVACPLSVIARCVYVYLLSPVCDKGAAYVCIMQSALTYVVCVCVVFKCVGRWGESEACKAATYFVQTTRCCCCGWGVSNVAVDIY